MRIHAASIEIQAIFLLAALRALLTACGVPDDHIPAVAARIAHLIAEEVRP